MEASPISIAERPSTAPDFLQTPENIDEIQRPSSGSSVSSSTHTPRSSNQSKKLPKIIESNHIHPQIEQEEPSTKTDSNDRTLTKKESLTEHNTTSQSAFDQKPYYHDVLVIQTQPPKVNKTKNIVLYCLFDSKA